MMDDIWDIKVWDKLKRFFPNNDNGSRIMLTSRLSKLGSQVPNSDSIHMDFLDEGNSWNLFSKIVFGEDGCPLELKELGKRIVANCKGLPLSIVVIGGILAKSNQAQHYWEHIAENLNAIVNSEDDERCLKILHMSYKQLPVHLRPCFLYMGVLPEDATIRVSMLIKLWVAEGFLKPISGKSLEEVAEECLKELINRNLVLVNKFGSTGNIKYCSMHDLLSDLCLREAQKERLYCVPLTQHYLKTNTQRRLIIPSLKLATKALHSMFLALNDFQSISSTRSLIFCRKGVISSLNFRLLRILKAVQRDAYYEEKYFLENTFQLVNSRYLAIRAHPDSKFPASVHLLWNLHTLIVKNNQDALTAPVDIWNMPQLRNVEFDRLYLPDPPRVHGHDDIVLGNLRTLFRIRNFKCSEEVVKRIPNLKKLKLYMEVDGNLRYGLRNLRHLHKLESFSCYSEPRIQPPRDGFLQNLTFPQSLKKLSLEADHVYWDDILDEIGLLPLLEKLKLLSGSFRRLEWRTVDGQFRSLKFLLISRCKNLISWTMENSHFPRLKHLDLRHLHYLEEIPSSVGDIPTLQSMELVNCNDNVIISAKRILKEQEEVGNQSLHIRVSLFQKNQVLQSLASTNFQVECI